MMSLAWLQSIQVRNQFLYISITVEMSYDSKYLTAPHSDWWDWKSVWFCKPNKDTGGGGIDNRKKMILFQCKWTGGKMKTPSHARSSESTLLDVPKPAFAVITAGLCVVSGRRHRTSCRKYIPARPVFLVVEKFLWEKWHDFWNDLSCSHVASSFFCAVQVSWRIVTVKRLFVSETAENKVFEGFGLHYNYFYVHKKQDRFRSLSIQHALLHLFWLTKLGETFSLWFKSFQNRMFPKV